MYEYYTLIMSSPARLANVYADLVSFQARPENTETKSKSHISYIRVYVHVCVCTCTYVYVRIYAHW